MCQVSYDCKYLSTTATFSIGTEKFSTTGKTLLDSGYTTVMTWQAFAKNETVPSFNTGEVVTIQDVSTNLLTASGLIEVVEVLIL